MDTLTLLLFTSGNERSRFISCCALLSATSCLFLVPRIDSHTIFTLRFVMSTSFLSLDEIGYRQVVQRCPLVTEIGEL